MTAPSYMMRPYAEADERSVLEFLRLVLGEGGRTFDRSEAFWRWKHFQSPFGASLILVAENTQILGLRAFMRWQFRAADGARFDAVRAVDTATHPASRRQGVFSALTKSALEQAAREGVDLIFNTPNEQSLPGYLKLGWTYVGRPTLLVKVLRPLSVVRRLVGPNRPPAIISPGEPVVTADALVSHSTQVARLLDQNDALLGDGIRTARSIEYLRWRYATIPSTRPYYACWGGETPANCVAILRLGSRGRWVEAMIAELLLNEMGAFEVPRLLRSLRQAVSADYVAAHAARGSAHWRALRANGFIPVPRIGPHLVIRTLGEGSARWDPAVLGGWRLAIGDLELF